MTSTKQKNCILRASITFDGTDVISNAQLPVISRGIDRSLTFLATQNAVKKLHTWRDAEPDIFYTYKAINPAKLHLDVKFSGQIEAPMNTPTIEGRLIISLSPALHAKHVTLEFPADNTIRSDRAFHDVEEIVHHVLQMHGINGTIKKNNQGALMLCVEGDDGEVCDLVKGAIVYRRVEA